MSIITYVALIICLHLNSIEQIFDKNEVSVLSFGAIPNDGNEDTQSFQAAIDFAQANQKSVIRIPKGEYTIGSLKFNSVLSLLGAEGAVLKKKADAGKWSRMLSFYRDERNVHGTYIIKDIVFDGNYKMQGAFKNYELQQQHLVYVEGKNNRAEKVNLNVSDCEFRNSVADGISAYTNVKVIVKNNKFKNIFRGAVVVTGGNSIVEVDGLVVEKGEISTGIDVEPQGKGFDGTRRVDVSIKNAVLWGRFDLGLQDNSSFFGDNIVANNSIINIMAANDSKVLIKKSTFNTLNSLLRRIIFPNNVSFEDCSFYMNSVNESLLTNNYILKVIWESKTQKPKQQKVNFTRCTFNGSHASVKNIGVLLDADKLSNNNKIDFLDCTVGSDLQYGVYMTSGGNFSFTGGNINCKVPFYLSSNTLKQTNYNVKLSSIKALTGVKQFASINGDNKDTIIFDNLTLDKATADLEFRHGAKGINIKGARKILYSGPKPGKKQFSNDVLIRKN